MVWDQHDGEIEAYEDEMREIARLKREHVKSMRIKYKGIFQEESDFVLLMRYAAEARNSEEVNNVVKDGGFPAFDIAMDIMEHKKQMTDKQREALQNVLASYYAHKERIKL